MVEMKAMLQRDSGDRNRLVLLFKYFHFFVTKRRYQKLPLQFPQASRMAMVGIKGLKTNSNDTFKHPTAQRLAHNVGFVLLKSFFTDGVCKYPNPSAFIPFLRSVTGLLRPSDGNVTLLQ